MDVDALEELVVAPYPAGTLGEARDGLQKLALSLTDLSAAAGDVDPEPTEAQKESGNYKKGHVSWKGLGITIETAKGQYRRGKSPEGKEWSTLMRDHYGYIKGTESEADGDHIDIFLSEDHLDSEVVFIVNQVDPAKGVFDEHKCILGTISAEQAEEVYLRNYSKGWQGLGSITAVTLEQFKWWMEHADTSKEIVAGFFAKNLKQVKSSFDKQATEFTDYTGQRFVYKPCPECEGEMTNKTEDGDTMRGSVRCLDCGHSQSGLKWAEKKADLLPDVQLQPHQQAVAETAMEPEKRMLLYHALGSGKTLTSLAAAETAGDPYTAIAPASLRPNYRKEQEKWTDMKTPSNLASYNSVARGQVAPTDTLVFDEAQRMRNPDSLTTQNAIQLADKAKHLYLLSGTPVVNHPHDLTPMIRMLTGKQYSPEEFDKTFIDERKVSPGFVGWLRGVKPVTVPTMKNKEKFDELLQGHVSHFAPDKPDVEQKEEHYTAELGPEQTKLYQGFWDQLPWLFRWKLQNDFPMSRQEMVRLSSFLSGPRQVGLSTYPFMRGKADAYKAFQQSPKLQMASKMMTEALAKDKNMQGVAFSNFIDAGLTPYAAALKAAKIPYGIFHGGLNDAARKKAVEDYNTGKSRVLLLGPSGGEGISLKGTRLLQLLDPHWNTARSEQAIGRGVRYDSHMNLPLEDRNVRIQRFVSHMPRTMWQKIWRTMLRKKDVDPRRQSPGVDTYLENLGQQKDQLNQQFLDELKLIGKQAADEAESEIPFTIAVDLDGTLAAKEEPFNSDSIGDLIRGRRKWMKQFAEAGIRIIVFTVRDNNDLVRTWLNENEIPFDYINENPDQPPNSSGKVFADIYLDDRAIDATKSDGWEEALERALAAI